MSVNQLSYYAQRVAETRGMVHQTMLLALRNYIKTTPESLLIADINEIYKFNELKALWEAGLSYTLQDTALKRYDELKARRD